MHSIDPVMDAKLTRNRERVVELMPLEEKP
jgi:hypothetical protein